MTDSLTATPRRLTARERDVLALLVDRGVSSDPDQQIAASDRARWSARLSSTFAGRACGCGQCPSIELTDATGVTPTGGSRVVLEAQADGAVLLLFIDDDRPSYLELAPTDERTFARFPDPAVITAT